MKRLSISLILAALTVTACEDSRTVTAPAENDLVASMNAAAATYDCADQTQILQTECEALVALYDSTNGSDWTASTNWLVTGPCDWLGVGVGLNDCTGGSVTQLILFDNNLSGPIPPELGSLSNLRDLGIQANKLTGVIPAELGNLKKLETLQLYANQLTGQIPAELGGLSALHDLNLEQNQLSGPIPAELGNLSNLWGLNLLANQLSGPIPAELGNLGNLEQLWVYQNQLSGAIPAELGNLSKLKALVLHENQLSGPIPAELGNLSSLERLDLRLNQLSGPIPAELGNLVNLSVLWLGFNQLSGLVPIGVAALGGSAPLAGDCWFVPGNHGLYMPDNELYRTYADVKGEICGLGLSSFVPVTIDIKPGSDPNSINCDNPREVIAVAILTTDDFDATTVDHTTVTFEAASETHTTPQGVQRHEKDVDDDADLDLVLHFRLGDTGLTCASTEGTLSGGTFNGQAIQDTDAVNMIDRGGGKP